LILTPVFYVATRRFARTRGERRQAPPLAPAPAE
jgi:hypothetical protein